MVIKETKLGYKKRKKKEMDLAKHQHKQTRAIRKKDLVVEMRKKRERPMEQENFNCIIPHVIL